jgi:hypothetical protein
LSGFANISRFVDELESVGRVSVLRGGAEETSQRRQPKQK